MDQGARGSLGRAGLGLVAALLVAGALDFVSAQGAASITGRVTDSRTSAPVRGVLVEAVGQRGTAVTGLDGRFVLEDVQPGTHTVRLSWFGYRDREVSVIVAAGAALVLDVALEAAPIPLGEIRVSAVSREPERIVDAPAAVAVVPPGRVRDLAATGQVPLLLAELPGVQVMQSGVNSFNVNPRSFNTLVNRRLLVLLDGRDVGAAFVGSPEWTAVSVLEDRASVELIRGPGSALYGANAFTGVLNILTPSVRQAQGTRATASWGEGSSVSLDGRHAFVSGAGGWGLRVAGGYSRAGTIDRSRTNVGDLAAEYAGATDATVQAPLPGYEVLPLAGQSKATPFGVPGPTTGDPDPTSTLRGEARVDRYLTGVGIVTAEGGFTRVENQVNASAAARAQIRRSDVPWARLAWATAAFNLMANYAERSGDQLDLSNGGTFRDSSGRLHVEGQANRRFAGERGRVVAGASARRETIDSKGTVLAPEHDGRSDQYYALFAQTDFRLASQFEVVLAGRYDASSLFDAEVSPRAALVWTPVTDQSFRATYGRAYLMPSPTQRFVRFPLGPPVDLSLLEAGLRASPLGPSLAGVPAGTLLTNSAAVPALTIGDEDLGPEEVTALELGYKGQFERVFLSADFHYSDFENFHTDLLPGVHPKFGPWTAPATVPAAAAPAVEAAVLQSVPGLTRLEDGSTAILYAGTGAGRATQWGVDVNGAIQTEGGLGLSATYSLVAVEFEQGSFLGADSVPANTPAHTASLAATFAGSDDLRVRAGLTLTDGFDFRSGVWQGTVPGRQTLDLSARRRLGAYLSAGLSVTNALDQRRFHYVGGSIVGRRLVASMTWER